MTDFKNQHLLTQASTFPGETGQVGDPLTHAFEEQLKESPILAGPLLPRRNGTDD